jgi:hypothetical protein
MRSRTRRQTGRYPRAGSGTERVLGLRRWQKRGVWWEPTTCSLLARVAPELALAADAQQWRYACS